MEDRFLSGIAIIWASTHENLSSGVHTSLLSYRDWKASLFFACTKCIYHTFQRVNNKGADQTALMHRLLYTFVFCVQSQVLSLRGPYSKTFLKRPLKKDKNWVFKTGYRLIQEHSAILSTCINLPSVFKTFVLSIFEWPLKTGFTVIC